MKKNYGIFVLLSVTMGLTACDDGSIPRKEHTATHTGFAAKLTGHITGADSWPEYYQLVLAGFGDSEYATTQVLVSPDANSNVSLTLPNIGSNVKTIELCVTNRLRKRVLTYQSLDVASISGDTLYMDAGQVDAHMYAAIQENIFDKTCAQCHGGSTSPAAGLYLTADKSHASLVNQPSTQVEDGIRVIPGNAEESILHKVINPGNVLGLGFSHENMITSSTDLRLIDEWINAGAKE